LNGHIQHSEIKMDCDLQDGWHILCGLKIAKSPRTEDKQLNGKCISINWSSRYEDNKRF
jgi:hypothetical protein